MISKCTMSVCCFKNTLKVYSVCSFTAFGIISNHILIAASTYQHKPASHNVRLVAFKLLTLVVRLLLFFLVFHWFGLVFCLELNESALIGVINITCTGHNEVFVVCLHACLCVQTCKLIQRDIWDCVCLRKPFSIFLFPLQKAPVNIWSIDLKFFGTNEVMMQDWSISEPSFSLITERFFHISLMTATFCLGWFKVHSYINYTPTQKK